MIRYLKHSEIDKSKWDACITDSANGIIYAYSWYLDIVCEGWDALVSGDYSTVMPLTKGKKYFINYLYPPFFTQQLGVFSKYIMTEAVYLEFLNSIPRKFRFIEINLHVSNQWIPDGFTAIKNSDYILELDKPYHELRLNYNENHHRNCNKAAKQGLNIFRFEEIGKVIDMFRINKGKQIGKLTDVHYEVFRKLAGEALNRKMAKIWSVSDTNGVPVAAAAFFESHRKSIFIFSAITAEGKKLSAMHFLIDQYINENCLHTTELDFEGSNDPELARFYKGFGSKEFVYLQIKKNELPAPWSWVKK